MKKQILLSIAAIFIVAILYCAFAFYSLTFDPRQWDEVCRAMYLFFSAAAIVFVFGIGNEN